MRIVQAQLHRWNSCVWNCWRLPHASAAQAQVGPTGQPSSSGLPARGEFIIRNGFILTMDAALGDIPRGSVHVRNGEIVAVGAGVNAPAAEVIDAPG